MKKQKNKPSQKQPQSKVQALKAKLLNFLDQHKGKLSFSSKRTKVLLLSALGLTLVALAHSKYEQKHKEHIVEGCNRAAKALNTPVGVPVCVMNRAGELAFAFNFAGTDLYLNLETKRPDPSFMER